MPKKKFKAHLPTRQSIQQNRWLEPYAHSLQHPNLWHLNRRSVSGGVAVGLLCGLIPGPLQMLGAALLSVWLRVNLPVALFSTLYTNPFTILPLYILAHRIGAWVLGLNGISASSITIPQLRWDDWWQPLLHWLASLGKALVIGLPLLAILLSCAGYFLVRLGWRGWVLWKLHKRYRRVHKRAASL